MAKIYLINVGANDAHRGQARSPMFPDRSFEFVTFPQLGSGTLYPSALRRFVKASPGLGTHSDPDWKNLTYGDLMTVGRGGALSKAQPGDVLLFWGLLWRLQHQSQNVFDCNKSDREWCLFGLMVVEDILEPSQPISRLEDPKKRQRASKNAHIEGGRVTWDSRVFLGNQALSQKFKRAVNLSIGAADSILLQTIQKIDGSPITWKNWMGVTRCCRAVLDSAESDHTKRIRILEDAIAKENPGFNFKAIFKSEHRG